MKTLTVQQTKDPLQNEINRHVNLWITRKWVGPLNYEKKITRRRTEQGRLKTFKNIGND